MAVAPASACSSSSAEHPSFAEVLSIWRKRDEVAQSRAKVDLPLSSATACAAPCEPTVEVEGTVKSTFESPSESTYQAISEEISTCESTKLQVTLSSAPAAEEEETEEDLSSDCDQTSAGSNDSKETVSVRFSVSKTSCAINIVLLAALAVTLAQPSLSPISFQASGGPRLDNTAEAGGEPWEAPQPGSSSSFGNGENGDIEVRVERTHINVKESSEDVTNRAPANSENGNVSREAKQGPEFDEEGYVSRDSLQAIASDVAVNGTVVVLVTNIGYADFLLNWAVYADELGYGRRFLVFAEDSESFQLLSTKFPRQVLRWHVPEIEQAGAAELRAAGIGDGGGEGAHPGEAEVGAEERADAGVKELPDSVNFNATGTYPMARASANVLTAKLCGGFVFLRSSPGGHLVLDAWSLKIAHAPRIRGNENDQFYLGAAISDVIKTSPAPLVGVLPQKLFPPGWLFFRGDSNMPPGTREGPWWRLDEEEKARVVTVHNNWLMGKSKKLARFKKNKLWKLEEV
ncbi:unnamed protein product [Closterium sp. Yama58-4]|nr:unnamed protein product [Closterium sp. Yama58-4]